MGATRPYLLSGRQPMKVELLLPLQPFLPMCQLWLQVKTHFSKPKRPLGTKVLGWCLSCITSQLLFQDAVKNQAFFPLCCSLVFSIFFCSIDKGSRKNVFCSAAVLKIWLLLLPPRQHSHELEPPYFLGSCRHSPLKLVIWRFNSHEWSVCVHMGLPYCVFRLMTNNYIIYILCNFIIIIPCLSDWSRAQHCQHFCPLLWRKS